MQVHKDNSLMQVDSKIDAESIRTLLCTANRSSSLYFNSQSSSKVNNAGENYQLKLSGRSLPKKTVDWLSTRRELQASKRNSHKDFQHCLFACFVSQNEPKKISEALEDASWVDAIQEELLQFKIQKVWILVDLPYGKKAIGTKWVYRNKKDGRARIEAIRIFLAFASYMGFIVYQMDVKSAFLYRKIDDEVYVSQPPGFIDPKYPKKVYKVVKALYGLHQAPRACQDKYVAEIMKKFDFANVKTASIPIETQKPLVKDEEASDVDFCACSRFQVTPKTSHLNAVKRIFRFQKGKPKLGLWYPRVSSFDLESYSDSDYVAANLTGITTEVVNFLAGDLFSRQLQKSRPIVAYFYTIEAEYVVLQIAVGKFCDSKSNFRLMVQFFMNTKIYIDNESTICIVKNPVYHSKTKHIAIRHHFIRDAYEKKLIQVAGNTTVLTMCDSFTKAFDVSRFQFLVVTIGMINP
ncbi:putative ribonuclease H-like domain-containing protein [Tanacetum coccineum]